MEPELWFHCSELTGESAQQCYKLQSCVRIKRLCCWWNIFKCCLVCYLQTLQTAEHQPISLLIYTTQTDAAGPESYSNTTGRTTHEINNEYEPIIIINMNHHNSELRIKHPRILVYDWLTDWLTDSHICIKCVIIKNILNLFLISYFRTLTERRRVELQPNIRAPIESILLLICFHSAVTHTHTHIIIIINGPAVKLLWAAQKEAANLQVRLKVQTECKV